MVIGEMISIFSGILTSVLENEALDTVEQVMENGKKKKLEKKTVESIEHKIREQLEQDSVKEWLDQQRYQIEQKGCLFSQEDKQALVRDFFDKNPEIRYVHSQYTEMVLLSCIDEMNKWADGILSDSEKIMMASLKNDGQSNTQEIMEKIDASKQEILYTIREYREVECTGEEVAATEKKKCSGYGRKRGKCENFVLEEDDIYCKDCLTSEYVEKIENLYRIQHYSIENRGDFFIAEQNSGIIRANALVIPIYAETDELSIDDVEKLQEIICKEIDTWQYIHLVTNGIVGKVCKNYIAAYQGRIKIFHEQDIIHEIMDFTGYLKNHIDQYYDSSLFGHYIDILDRNTGEPLEYSVRDFLQGTQYNAFLILGDYGCGKTSFLRNLAYQLAEEYSCNENGYIPVFIPLRDYAKAINMENLFLDIFVNKCHMSNFSIEAFKLMLKYMRFVLLFDGFDEVAKRVNYDVKYEIFQQICQYCGGNTKVIVTCRPNYFQENREYEKLIESAHLQFEPGAANQALFQETYIADLEPEQVHAYVLSYEEVLEKEGLNADKIEHIIGNTHDLTDLSRRPFLLNIIVQTLPKIISDLDDSEKKNKINAALLYKRYTDLWLDRENSKGKTLIRKEDKMYFCMHIAYRMYQDDVLEIHFSKMPDEIRTYFPNLHQIDEIDYFSHDIRSCSFMNSDGNGYFKFIHKSFMEYFVAYFIVEKLRRDKHKAGSLIEILAAGDISSEVALFINDLLCGDEELCRKIKAELEGQSDNEILRIKQNAISLLSKMNYNMADDIGDDTSYINSDFSRALIKNKHISGVDFSGAILANSDISDVKFRYCNFREANFQKARLTGVDFTNQWLEYADLSYCEIRDCNFSGCCLVGAKLSWAVLENNDFGGCDMSGVEAVGTIYKNNYNYQSAIGIPYDMN